jgi:uncharacterized repeat protein (TIGR03803 family)
MKISDSWCHSQSIGIAAAAITLMGVIFVACGAPQNGVPSTTSRGSNLYRAFDRSMLGVHGLLSPSVQSVYAFTGEPDGAFPFAGLTNVNGLLYGTTKNGGTGPCGGGCGTIFGATTNGLERVNYRFQGGSDGFDPTSDLIFENNTIYGTTFGGGTGACANGGCGTIFATTTSSGKKVWTYSFQGGTDGAYPYAGLVSVNGVLFGTTAAGGNTGSACGSLGCGTIFGATGGLERVEYRFQGGSDGSGPTSRLINVNGTLYGTTFGGGNHGDGTVFSVTTSGSEKVLHSFAGGTDGKGPYAGLVYVNGALYGTTWFQGAKGYGTVFAVTLPSGTERVFHSFAGGTDGAHSFADLIDVNGTLYGTTSYGGGGPCADIRGTGCGTVYSVTVSSGTEKVIYAFQGGDDGQAPWSRLYKINSTLFGTTEDGGAKLHDGNIFSLKV